MNKSIPFYWKRSIKALQSAKVLYERCLYEDCISRAYYAVLNAARSVLLIHNIKTQSHTAVQRQFGKQLVQTGEIEREWAILLSREYTFRSNADYSEQFEADSELALQLFRDAERFVERMKQYLNAHAIEV